MLLYVTTSGLYHLNDKDRLIATLVLDTVNMQFSGDVSGKTNTAYWRGTLTYFELHERGQLIMSVARMSQDVFFHVGNR